MHCSIEKLSYDYNFLLPVVIGHLHTAYLVTLEVNYNNILILLLHNSY